MTRLFVFSVSLGLVLAIAPACGDTGGTAPEETPAGSSGTTGTAGKAGSGTSGASGSGPSAGSSGASAGGSGGATGGSGGATAGAAGSGASAGSGTSGTAGSAGTGTAGSGTGGATAGAGGTGTAGAAGTGTGGGTAGAAGSGGASPTAVLTIVPSDVTLSPPSGVAPSLAFKAILKAATGPDVDVTTSTAFSLQPASFGTFTGPVFGAPAGTLGMAKVVAMASGQTATTNLTITAPQVIIGPGAAADAPGKFGGADDPGAKPNVVYPPSGTLVPPNMNSLEFHFVPAAGQTLFQIAFQSKSVSLSVYVGCTKLGTGCVYAPDKAFWSLLANTARGGAPVTYTVKGVNGGSPGAVGASASRTIQFSTDDLSGGIYYWNSGGTIQRYDFGYPGNAAETYLNAPSAGAAFCVGCHTLSRDGKKMAVGLDIPSPAVFKVLDVATKSSAFQIGSTFGGGANFFSFSPDSTRLLSSNGVDIQLRDAATGAQIGGNVVSVGTMPDWSPDGATIVFAKPKTAPPCVGGLCGAAGVSSASIQTISHQNGVFGAPKEIVAFTSQNNYYPAISPDGGWVVFNRSPANRDSFANASVGDNGEQPDGQMWIVPLGGGPAIFLGAASKVSDQWPKWAPDAQTYEGGKVMWVTTSSRRGYGLRTADGDKTQLWMTAIDPAKAAAGQDPSFPAFWLPFQDLGTGNHIAQWVTKVERKPCGTGSECAAGEVCTMGRCVPQKPLSPPGSKTAH